LSRVRNADKNPEIEWPSISLPVKNRYKTAQLRRKSTT